MIDDYISVQDIIAIAVLVGVGMKLIQFYHFDKLNRRKK